MNLTDLALPAAMAGLAWLSRHWGAPDDAPPPGERLPGPADVPWPAAPPPRRTTPGTRPMTPDERRLSRDEPPVDHLDRMTPGERERVRQARGGAPAGAGWRPAQRPTQAEVARARALLGAGWREGVLEETGDTQYRGAYHPSRGGGRHKGVEVWHRAPAG